MNTQTTNAPEILTAKTYFWSSAKSASQRRNNEAKRLAEVAQYFVELGFAVETTDRVIASKTNGSGDICEVVFTYEESAKNVYKHFSVEINGKRSNIKGLEKFLSK